MKKLLAGCLVVGVLLGVAAAAGAYFLWRAARPVVDSALEMADGASRLSEVVAFEDRLADTATYAGPENGELTADQVDRFLRVQAHVKATLGTRAEAFKEKYKELGTSRPDGTDVPPSLSQLLSGLSDLSQIYVDARRAQVAAMNAAGFSRDEFSWVRHRVYQAAGLDAVRYDARDLERLIKAVASGVQVAEPAVTLPDAPARNRALVKPHVPELAHWLGLAVFGL